jgi:hypothetical protein
LASGALDVAADAGVAGATGDDEDVWDVVPAAPSVVVDDPHPVNPMISPAAAMPIICAFNLMTCPSK